ncbi:MAG: hypothetical protein JJE42_19065 [Burkholderiales bacterium]|nr:hypothetical protein [Burkholderiales bacterium]
MKRVVVHIDRLVLKGFRHEDRHAIAAGLQHELSRVFADRQTLSNFRALGDVPRVQVGSVQFEQGAKPRRVGENVAQGIGTEIRK